MQNTETHNVTGKVMMELSEREAKVIEHLRAFAFGKIIVHQENNQPVRIEEIRLKLNGRFVINCEGCNNAKGYRR